MAEEITPVAETATDETSAPVAEDTTPESPDAQPELNEALSPVEGATAEPEQVEVPGGREYEVMFIVRANESTEAATDRARTVLQNNGGVVDNARTSEQRHLSYPIKKQTDGFYVVLNGRFSKEAAAELDRELKLDEAVLRHMILRQDED